ncbi:chemotaxis protein CheA [Terrihabitans rhizophilus]|uniref:histidine kinase n=1 Tax=Terrihabitans rhizophilus TaxID=3092662 RepID=A0ABU4RS46_9HYPH|nr:ATP-binding protein [Terrihabitans sp. PJ23]MDX6807431.1 ATP-binding protein [Terrihabitans sp. PJ23]
MDDLLADFLNEAEAALDAIERELGSPQASKHTAPVLRLFHTIKGTCSFFDFPRVAALAHAAETWMVEIRDGASLQERCPHLLAAVERIRWLLDVVEAQGSEPPGDDADITESKGIGAAVLTQGAWVLGLERYDPALAAVRSRLAGVSERMRLAIEQNEQVPVSLAWHKLPRILRHLARDLRRDVDLHLEGGGTPVPKGLVEALDDPLIQLVRNCLAHGIEDDETRLLLGKAVPGRIAISARAEEDRLLLSVSDDGCGLDHDKIAKTALARGLVTPDELASMTREEVFGFIFAPGFSTFSAVSMLAGRGIGLDIVKHVVDERGGSIVLDSRPGQGTRILLDLPMAAREPSVDDIRLAGQQALAPKNWR